MILGELHKQRFDLVHPYESEWVVFKKTTIAALAIPESDPLRTVRIMCMSLADWSVTDANGKTSAISVDNIQKLPVDWLEQVSRLFVEFQNAPKAG